MFGLFVKIALLWFFGLTGCKPAVRQTSEEKVSPRVVSRAAEILQRMIKSFHDMDIVLDMSVKKLIDSGDIGSLKKLITKGDAILQIIGSRNRHNPS